MKPGSPKTVCNVPRAAEILGTTQAAIYMKVARRQIPFRKYGSRVIFFEEELFEFIEKLPGLTIEELKKSRKDGGL